MGVRTIVKDGEILLLFGGLPRGYLDRWEITSNLELAEEKLNVKFEIVSTEELLSKYGSLDVTGIAEAKRLAEEIIRKSLKDPKSKSLNIEEVEKATKLYVAMKSFVEEHEADAVTIDCGPWTRTPCIALTLLQEEGIPAACQGDIDALLTMVLFKRASGLASFMGGGIKASGHLGVSHCVLSRNACGLELPPQPYYLSDYHGRKTSPTIHTTIPEGQMVTVARLTRNLGNLILTWGVVIENQDEKDRCRNTVVIKVKDRDKVLKAVRGVQQHLVVACRDQRKAMTSLAKEAGISVINV